MDQLFAPWRIEWVTRAQRPGETDGCVLCDIRDGSDDRDNLVVARSPGAYVLLNNYPYNPAHVMVVPHSHTGELAALEGQPLESFVALTQATTTALEQAYQPDGINIGMNLGGSAAGGSIDDHVHQHVIPRWSGDTNFMPVISETKVIVEALDDTYDRLVETFGSLPSFESADDTATPTLRQD